ncbi:3-beta hydroxysteroid dehydrogenase/isomerase family-domain-containing protein [Mycena metata]|uniref:3-beta hydroxysteroid dehydrogenase/isomerase family-domain-containing protein n=1 Tax=Mycena metata TaxID=1033252 RepID=A0AAD7NE33_9AGAR|nr:3-beta hydroxysteroid dehydrogenase/isomerase family-domain-containing protein [Mycena metata]
MVPLSFPLPESTRMEPWVVGLFLAVVLLFLYIRLNDSRLTRIPDGALAFSPTRCTTEEIQTTAARLQATPISIVDQIPPKTGRRYIVVGGAGFLGGWIVMKLLDRGEDPRRIRVLDIRAPARADLTTGPAKNVQFILGDISDRAAVDAAFNAPWPDDNSQGPLPPLTVFHTAASIRFYEKTVSLLSHSARVNVKGTENIINASRAVGATIMVYTSSGSVSIRRSRFLLWPWEKEPPSFVQAINEDEAIIPKEHHHFFSNYAVSKMDAERRVRAADNTGSRDGVLRTGCLRPGNGVFGPGGDMLCGAYLVRKVNPTWMNSVIQNFVYVENAAVAHLLYEQRLIEVSNGNRSPDIGGQAFVIRDPGPPPTYGDVYSVLSTLTAGETTFPFLSPTLMILISHLIEWYYVSRALLLAAGYPLAHKIPALPSDIMNLQPSLFNLVNVHLIFDDSRARLPPEKGGLGYKGAWTTLEGLHKTVTEHKSGVSGFEQRSDLAGIGFGFKFGLAKAQKGAGNVGAKVSENICVDPVQPLTSA